MQITKTYSTGNSQVTVETEAGQIICLTLKDKPRQIVVSGICFEKDGTEKKVW